jgi:hypothetical protein
VQFVAFLGAFHHPGSLNPWVAGVVASLLTTWVTFVPCFLFVLLGGPYVERLRGNHALSAARQASPPPSLVSSPTSVSTSPCTASSRKRVLSPTGHCGCNCLTCQSEIKAERKRHDVSLGGPRRTRVRHSCPTEEGPTPLLALRLRAAYMAMRSAGPLQSLLILGPGAGRRVIQ